MNPPFHEGVKTSAAAGAGIHDFGNTPSETKMPSNGTSTTPLACRQCGRHSPTGWNFSWGSVLPAAAVRCWCQSPFGGQALTVCG